MIKNSDNKEYIEKILREGAVSEFWEILKEALDENVENLERLLLNSVDDLEDLPADEVKLRLMLFKEKREHYRKLKELPYMIVQSFGSPDQSDLDLDVYNTKDDFLPKNEEKE